MGRWRKVLYLQQPYPDNYVDPAQFLDGLRKNGKFGEYVMILEAIYNFIRECVMYSFHRDV